MILMNVKVVSNGEVCELLFYRDINYPYNTIGFFLVDQKHGEILHKPIILDQIQPLKVDIVQNQQLHTKMDLQVIQQLPVLQIQI